MTKSWARYCKCECNPTVTFDAACVICLGGAWDTIEVTGFQMTVSLCDGTFFDTIILVYLNILVRACNVWAIMMIIVTFETYSLGRPNPTERITSLCRGLYDKRQFFTTGVDEEDVSN